MRPLGTYRLHTRTPPHVAPSARASAAASTSGLPLHVGCPSKPTATSSIPTRDAMATPFHWLKPQCTTSYPMAANGMVGNWSSVHLVSCMASTSTSARSSQSVTRSTRARMELTFQVASRMATGYGRRYSARGAARVKPSCSYNAIAGALSTSTCDIAVLRALLGGPGHQRRAQRARVASRRCAVGDAHRRHTRPAGSVRRRGDRPRPTAASPRVAKTTSPSTTAVSTSTGTSRS